MNEIKKNVATVRRISNIRKHPNADTLSLGTVLGWQVVFNHEQNSYQEGELLVYFEIDSVVPEKPEFEFLRNKHFRVRPIRLRGEASNGLCMPLHILPEKEGGYQEGDDVTDFVGAFHYEKPLPAALAGQVLGRLPGFIIKTDEDNLRSYPEALDELRGREYYITRKDDGSSGTFYFVDGHFGVCSRNLELKEDDKNTFWKMAHQYELEKQIRDYYLGQKIAVQGEVVGPGVNGNALGLTQHELHIFSIQFIEERSYGTFVQVRDFCNTVGLPMVTLIEMGDKFLYDLPALIKLTNAQRYPNGKPAEGIVIRPQWPLVSTVLNKAWSGKIINENYKDED